MAGKMNIGVLALQGAFAEHVQKLRRLDVDTVEVRLREDLAGVQGLIIPGGESSVIGKLAQNYDLMNAIRRFAVTGPVWGTCAGMILMAKDVGRSQPLLGIMDIAVERNAFGRQVDSFVTDLVVDQIPNGPDKPFPAVFIRAPKITAVGRGVSIIAALPGGTAVAARQKNHLATAFHPELTSDNRFHRFFLELVSQHPPQDG